MNRKGFTGFAKVGVGALFSLVIIAFFVVYVLPVFADTGTVDGINITISTPANFTNTTSGSANFTYIPVWNDTVNMFGCTVFSNVSGAWGANTTNSTILLNDTINYIEIGYPEGEFIWNVYCNETVNLGDFYVSNNTLRIDQTNPYGGSESFSNLSYTADTTPLIY
ncbi:MAG: hypothetical protein ABIH90_01355, partial [Candidatus Aenigmatarchaeota archaeon]